MARGKGKATTGKVRKGKGKRVKATRVRATKVEVMRGKRSRGKGTEIDRAYRPSTTVYRRPPKSLANPRNIKSVVWASAIVPQASALLNLPAEIRLQIWQLALTSESDEIRPKRRRHRFSNTTENTAPRVVTALIRTSRQIYVDVRGGALMYPLHHFVFDDPRLLVRFMKVIGSDARDTIRSMHVHFTSYYPNPYSKPVPTQALDTLTLCRGLRKLHIDLHHCFPPSSYKPYLIQRTYGQCHNCLTDLDQWAETADEALNLSEFKIHVHDFDDAAFNRQLLPTEAVVLHALVRKIKSFLLQTRA